jgi:type I restriction enzyme S subunit
MSVKNKQQNTRSKEATLDIDIPMGWSYDILANVCIKFLNGGTPSTKIEKYWTGNIPWITGADFSNQKITNIRRFITENAIAESSTNLIEKGNLLIVTRTGVGKITIAPFDIAISQDITGVYVNKQIITVEFLFHYLNYYSFKLSKLNQGTSISGITRDTLEQINIPLPSLFEQKRIAQIISTWDKVIETTEKLIAEKENLKKGLMQQLLSGKKRFKGNKDRIIKVKLKNIVSDFIVPMRDKPKILSGEIPWCRIEDFDGKYLYDSKSNQGVSKATIKSMNLKVYPINTVLVSCSANVGICSIVKKELITNQTFIGLVPNSNISEELLYYIMTFKAHELNKLSSGTTISYLSREEFENFIIDIPSSINEQKKIANILSLIDTELKFLNNKLQKSKEQKKGLMQVLLTGKVRVKI